MIKIKWKWVYLVTIIFISFTIFILPKINKYTKDVIGNSESPDTSLVYYPEDIYHMAESYGESGRSTYIKLRWTFDVIWPIIYTLFLFFWTIKLLEISLLEKNSKFISLVPIIGMAFDFLENIGTTIIMFRYPLKSGLLANLTPIATFIKWIVLSGSFLIIIFLVVLIFIKKFKVLREG